MKMTRLLAAAILLWACRDTSNPLTGEHPDARMTTQADAPSNLPKIDGPMGAAATIKAVNMSPPAANTSVTITGVVTVGRVTSSSNATAWVQDAGGGPYSGIQLFCSKSSCAEYDKIDTLAPGEVVDVTGSYSVFQGSPELQGVTITKTGTTMAPVATVVTPQMVGKTTDSTSPAFTQWNQVLVRLAGPMSATNVTAPQFSVACSGSGSNPDAGAANVQYRGFEVTAGTTVVNIGLGFFDTLSYCLPGCGFACNDEVKVDDGFDSLQGVARVVDGFVRVDPPTKEDMPREGTTPTADAGAADVPMSMLDAPAATADAPGATADGPGGVVGDGTVRSITMDPPAEGAAVALSNVVVVGNELRTHGAQIYVQDQGGGQYSGLLLFCNDDTCKASLQALQPGDVVDAAGAFHTFTGSGGAITWELQKTATVPLSVTAKGTTANVVALDVPASVAALDATSPGFAPYNGVYVRVTGTATVASAHVAELDASGTGCKFFNAFQAAFSDTNVYVDTYFNDSLTTCVVGEGASCATCNYPVAGTDTFSSIRGVLRAEKFNSQPATSKVVLAPVDDLDIARPHSVRSLLFATPTNPVSVSGVIVTGVKVNASGSVNVFLQDPGGGRYSGIQLFCGNTDACKTNATALAVGDVVDATGAFSIFSGNTPEIASTTGTGAIAATVTKTGTGTPTVTTVSADLIAHATAVTSPHFAPYNQVLVEIAGPVTVTNLEPTALESSCGTGMPRRRNGVEVSAGGSSIYVTNFFTPPLTLCVPGGCDACANPFQMTDTFASMTGIPRVAFGTNITFAARSDADLPK
jgi:hypothetical protein